MNTLLLITYPHVVPVKALFVFGKTFEDIVDEKRETCDCFIDCQVSNTVKAQKSMKDIVRIVHLLSVVQSECYEATRLLLYAKKTKITTLLNNLSPHHTDTLFKSERK